MHKLPMFGSEEWTDVVFCASFRSSTIRIKVIPHAVSLFTGELAENEDYEDTDDEDEEEDCEKNVRYSACFYK